jgi:hypothetical protein
MNSPLQELLGDQRVIGGGVAQRQFAADEMLVRFCTRRWRTQHRNAALAGEGSAQPRRNRRCQHLLRLQQIPAFELQPAFRPEDLVVGGPDQLRVHPDLPIHPPD